jgi:8-amino-7-oxononanoate synthase
LEALRIVRDEPHRRFELLERAAWLRERLRRDGWNVGESESQIIPVIIGAPGPTMELSAALRQRGFLAPGIRPPSVPEGESLLRISLSFAHPPEALERLADALRELSLVPR